MNQQLSAEEVIEIIMKKTGMTREEVKEQVAKVRDGMNNLVNEQGAAYLLATNLNVSLTQGTVTPSQVVEIKDLVKGMGPVSIIAKIKRISKTKHFMRKDNISSMVKNIELMDSTGVIKASVWGNKVALLDDIAPGAIVRVSNAEPREGYKEGLELSLGNKSNIDPNVVDIDESKFPPLPEPTLISSITTVRDDYTVIGKIISRNGIRDFETKDGRPGKVTSITIADTTGSIKVTFWNEDTITATKYDVGSIVKLYDLRSQLNETTQKWELTYQYFSTIIPYEDSSLADIAEIDFNDQQEILLPIVTLTENVNNLTLIGKVLDIYDLRNFQSQNGEGKVQSISVGDQTGIIKVTIWNEQTDQIANLQLNDLIKITNCYTKINNYSQQLEINAGKYADISINPPELKPENYTLIPKLLHFADIESKETAVSIRLMVTDKLEPRDITRKSDNTPAKVQNLNVIDELGERGKLAAWDDDIKLIEQFNINDTIEVQFVRARRDDYGVNLTLGRNSSVTAIDDFSGSVAFSTADKIGERDRVVEIGNLVENEFVKVEGTIQRIFEKIGFYDSCSQCYSKVVIDETTQTATCKEHGSVIPKKRMVISLTLDDGKDTVSVKFFADNAEKLLQMKAEDAFEMIQRLDEPTAPINQQKDKIELKKIWVKGKVKKDEVNSKLEISANKFGFVDPSQKTEDILNKYDQYFK